jgi:hypothetical protein
VFTLITRIKSFYIVETEEKIYVIHAPNSGFGAKSCYDITYAFVKSEVTDILDIKKFLDLMVRFGFSFPVSRWTQLNKDDTIAVQVFDFIKLNKVGTY